MVRKKPSIGNDPTTKEAEQVATISLRTMTGRLLSVERSIEGIHTP